jgi:hypothetical protein
MQMQFLSDLFTYMFGFGEITDLYSHDRNKASRRYYVCLSYTNYKFWESEIISSAKLAILEFTRQGRAIFVAFTVLRINGSDNFYLMFNLRFKNPIKETSLQKLFYNCGVKVMEGIDIIKQPLSFDSKKAISVMHDLRYNSKELLELLNLSVDGFFYVGNLSYNGLIFFDNWHNLLGPFTEFSNGKFDFAHTSLTNLTIAEVNCNLDLKEEHAIHFDSASLANEFLMKVNAVDNFLRNISGEKKFQRFKDKNFFPSLKYTIKKEYKQVYSHIPNDLYVEDIVKVEQCKILGFYYFVYLISIKGIKKFNWSSHLKELKKTAPETFSFPIKKTNDGEDSVLCSTKRLMHKTQKDLKIEILSSKNRKIS